MCGINLIYHWTPQKDLRPLMRRMNRALAHRGPDDSDILELGNSWLGHTRLSIVDIQGGHQPMVSKDGNYAIAYNGEIYNYQALRKTLEAQGVKLNTSSDTEVILQLYMQKGEAALSELRGMFSFIIAHRPSGRVFLARDRLGIKPLYYHWNNETLVASSEAKGLFASTLIEPKFNENSIRGFFKHQFSVSPYSLFEGVYELPPGHSMVVSPKQAPIIKQYWDLEFPFDGNYETEDEAYWLKKFSTALEDAAISHTIGEVPIAAYLSGGIDSSVTTYLLKEHFKQPPHTFSIHLTNPNSDESYAYKPVASHLQLENSELDIDDEGSIPFLEELTKCLYHLEQPQRMAVDIPHYLLSRFVKEAGFKVVYTGDGADEILAGYDCFRQDAIRLWGNQFPNEQERSAAYKQQYKNYFSEDFIALIAKLHEPENQNRVYQRYGTYPAWHDFWHILDHEEMFSENFLQRTSADIQMDELLSNIQPQLEFRDALNQSLYLETKTRLPGWILMKSDRLSMANGVEVRVPFLDHPLVELAAEMPTRLKLNDMNEKYILKMFAKPYLPKLQGEYKKRGFYTPIKEWFFGSHETKLASYLTEQEINRAAIFDWKQVEALINTLSVAPQPVDLNSYYRVMQLEWKFMLVLSTQILYRLFIAKEAPCFNDIE